MANNTKSNLDKPCFEYDLSFIYILFVTYKNQNCQTFRFDYIDMNMIIIGNLLPNFVSNDEYINTIFLLDDKIFVINEAFFQYMEENGEFLI